MLVLDFWLFDTRCWYCIVQEVIKRESELRQLGEKFRFKSLKDPPKLGLLKSHSFVKAAGVIGAVLVFTVVFILSYFVILCDKWVIKGWD